MKDYHAIPVMHWRDLVVSSLGKEAVFVVIWLCL
jgi:hypothetical protein